MNGIDKLITLNNVGSLKCKKIRKKNCQLITNKNQTAVQINYGFHSFRLYDAFQQTHEFEDIFDQSDHKEVFSIHFKLDVAFDGADEVDESLNLIKGGG